MVEKSEKKKNSESKVKKYHLKESVGIQFNTKHIFESWMEE